MVTKTSEESIVPCVATNPNITVILYEWDTNRPIKGHYVPSEGYRAQLEDRAYVCRGELNGEVKESQEFNVISIIGWSAAHSATHYQTLTNTRIFIQSKSKTKLLNLKVTEAMCFVCISYVFLGKILCGQFYKSLIEDHTNTTAVLMI